MKKNREIYLHIILIVGTLLLLSFTDIIVLEKIYHLLAERYSIPWEEFESNLFDKTLWWHLAFGPLSYGFFILLGIAARNWRLAVSGMILFATGLEDIFYYVLQLKWLPPELPWLDTNPLIASTKILTFSQHVSPAGLLISSSLGVIVAYLILRHQRKI